MFAMCDKGHRHVVKLSNGERARRTSVDSASRELSDSSSHLLEGNESQRHQTSLSRKDGEILTSLWRPHCDRLVGLVQLAETHGEHLDVVRGVWFQHRQFVGGLVAVRVHRGPLLGAHEPECKDATSVAFVLTQNSIPCVVEIAVLNSDHKSCSKTCLLFSPVVYEEGAGVQRKVFGARPGQSDGTKKVGCPLEVLDFIGQGVHWEKDERDSVWIILLRMAQPEINTSSQQVAALHCFQNIKIYSCWLDTKGPIQMI